MILLPNYLTSTRMTSRVKDCLTSDIGLQTSDYLLEKEKIHTNIIRVYPCASLVKIISIYNSRS